MVFDLLLIIAVSVLVGAIGSALATRSTQSEHERALLAELEGLRSAQRLSLKSWEARQAMTDAFDPTSDHEDGLW